MALKLLGIREQKENKAGKTGTKAVFREQRTPKIEKMLLGNKGTPGEFCCFNKGTREHGPPAPPPGRQTLNS